MAESNGSAETPQTFQLLSASYQSPSNPPFTHTRTLPAPASTATRDKVEYLMAVRKATTEMQERINKELTQRMEEDKTTEAAGAAGKAMIAVDEGKEEENYGEEVPEED